MQLFGIVTLTHNTELYNRMDEVKRRRYAGLPHAFLYNQLDGDPQRETDFIYRSPGVQESGIPMMIEKFVDFIERFIDESPWKDCSHIVRANASTFLNLDVLGPLIEKLPRTRCYAGKVVKRPHFVSGTCIVFSRDSASVLARTYREVGETWEQQEDDLVIAWAMRQARIPMRNIPMVQLIDGHVPNDEKLTSLLQTYPLVRIRNEPHRMTVDLAIWAGLDRLAKQPAR